MNCLPVEEAERRIKKTPFLQKHITKAPDLKKKKEILQSQALIKFNNCLTNIKEHLVEMRAFICIITNWQHFVHNVTLVIFAQRSASIFELQFLRKVACIIAKKSLLNFKQIVN